MKFFPKQTLKKISKRIFLIFSSIAIVLLIVGAVFGASTVEAGNGHSGRGWLWGGGTEPDGVIPWDGTNTNFGWISMNSLNCDTNGDGVINSGDTGRPTGCPSSGAVANYGVNIPSSNGNLSGYAWSPNVGWISFENSDLSGCPSGTCVASRDGSNLTGWARILSIKTAAGENNSGGWQGWIKLRGSNYGVSVNSNTGQLVGYAWSNELGWIDFSRSSISVSEKLEICPESGCIAANSPLTNISANVGGRTWCKSVQSSFNNNDL